MRRRGFAIGPLLLLLLGILASGSRAEFLTQPGPPREDFQAHPGDRSDPARVGETPAPTADPSSVEDASVDLVPRREPGEARPSAPRSPEAMVMTVPEPGSMVLMGLGLVAVLAFSPALRRAARLAESDRI